MRRRQDLRLDVGQCRGSLGICKEVARPRSSACIHLIYASGFALLLILEHDLTFWEESGPSILEVFAKVPAIAKIIISFNQLYSVPFEEAQFIRAPGFKIVCTTVNQRSCGPFDRAMCIGGERKPVATYGLPIASLQEQPSSPTRQYA